MAHRPDPAHGLQGSPWAPKFGGGGLGIVPPGWSQTEVRQDTVGPYPNTNPSVQGLVWARAIKDQILACRAEWRQHRAQSYTTHPTPGAKGWAPLSWTYWAVMSQFLLLNDSLFYPVVFCPRSFEGILKWGLRARNIGIRNANISLY